MQDVSHREGVVFKLAFYEYSPAVEAVWGTLFGVHWHDLRRIVVDDQRQVSRIELCVDPTQRDGSESLLTAVECFEFIVYDNSRSRVDHWRTYCDLSGDLIVLSGRNADRVWLRWLERVGVGDWRELKADRLSLRDRTFFFEQPSACYCSFTGATVDDDADSVSIDGTKEVFSERSLPFAHKLGLHRWLTFFWNEHIDDVTVVERHRCLKSHVLGCPVPNCRACYLQLDRPNILAPLHRNRKGFFDIVDLIEIGISDADLERIRRFHRDRSEQASVDLENEFLVAI